MTVERVEKKAKAVDKRLQETIQDWEQVLWEEFAAIMGGPANKEAFREMAIRMPWKVLKKYYPWPWKLEALLFGICGCLLTEKPQDVYYQQLRQEWGYLQAKHSLDILNPIALKFLRMRPAAFPTIRIAQLAEIIHSFPQLINILSPEGFQSFLDIPIGTSSYWDTHYRFFESTKKRRKGLGRKQKELVLINVLIPMAFWFLRTHGRENAADIIEEGLRKIPAENNRITRMFSTLGIKGENAFFSQGILQLKKHYCDAKRCLECGIGQRILRKNYLKELD